MTLAICIIALVTATSSSSSIPSATDILYQSQSSDFCTLYLLRGDPYVHNIDDVQWSKLWSIYSSKTETHCCKRPIFSHRNSNSSAPRFEQETKNEFLTLFHVGHIGFRCGNDKVIMAFDSTGCVCDHSWFFETVFDAFTSHGAILASSFYCRNNVDLTRFEYFIIRGLEKKDCFIFQRYPFSKLKTKQNCVQYIFQNVLANRTGSAAQYLHKLYDPKAFYMLFSALQTKDISSECIRLALFNRVTPIIIHKNIKLYETQHDFAGLKMRASHKASLCQIL